MKAIEAGARADLLPCPFCGGTDLKHYDAIKIVECRTCKAGTKERCWNERAALASGELVPASAVAAERKITPDWGKLVQCVLRCMDATIKNESSREQAERIATTIEERFAMDSAHAVAAERARCAAVLTAEITGMELHKFVFNGTTSTDSKGNDLFIAKSEVERLLNERAAAIRALSPEPASGEYVVVPAKPIGWFNPWNDYHGFQQVAEEFEGGPDTIPLYADQKTHDDLKTAMLNAATKDGERA